MAINDPNKYISNITIGDSLYLLKDELARTELSNIKRTVSGGLQFIGVTLTEITDGGKQGMEDGPDGEIVELIPASFKPPTMGGNNPYPNGTSLRKTTGFVDGDLVISAVPGKVNREFVWVGYWSEFGSTGSLGELAYKNGATVAQTTKSHTHTYTKTGNTHNVVNALMTSTGTFTPSGTIDSYLTKDSSKATLNIGSGTTLLTESDLITVSVNQTGKTVAAYTGNRGGSMPTFNTSSIKPISDLGSLPTIKTTEIMGIDTCGTMFKAEVIEGTETLVLTPGEEPTKALYSFDTIDSLGTLPTYGTPVPVLSSVKSAGSFPTYTTTDVAGVGDTISFNAFDDEIAISSKPLGVASTFTGTTNLPISVTGTTNVSVGNHTQTTTNTSGASSVESISITFTN